MAIASLILPIFIIIAQGMDMAQGKYVADFIGVLVKTINQPRFKEVLYKIY